MINDDLRLDNLARQDSAGRKFGGNTAAGRRSVRNTPYARIPCASRICARRRHDVQPHTGRQRGRGVSSKWYGETEQGAFAAPQFKHKKSNACFQFYKTQKCSFGDNCKFSHAKPAATEARVPAGGGAHGQGGHGIAGAGG